VTIQEILTRLGPGPERNQAAGALLRVLGELAALRLREPRSGEVYRIPPEWRDDVVQDVAFKVLAGSPLKVVGSGEEACRAYLCTMLVRRWISHHRRQRRAETLDAADTELAPAAHQPGATSEQGTEGLGNLDEVFAELLASRPPRHQGNARQAWSEILELHIRPITTRDLIERDASLREAEDPRGFKQRRDRMLQAHSRVREGMRQIIVRRQERGAIDAGEAEDLQRSLDLLWRCHRPAAGPTRLPEGDSPRCA
jgi:DNA-directed RNA polymerase specialized sigma24 family protein